jgi:GMP reductase|tara:strand:+ start:800 stop:1864 length:1065 start_codon:yes stop_codon:yes gene_type:complete
MRIETDIKLDFKDVLLKPKRSTLSSRRSVTMERDFTFRHWNDTKETWSGVPIMASNMDGVGTFSMANVLQEHNMLTVIKKHYTIEDWENAVGHGMSLNNIAVSTGTNAIFDPDAEDYRKAQEILTRWPDIKFICIDVANGYQQNFSDFVKQVRERFPKKIIIAGNVITSEMTEQLCIAGADIIKCGIGPGSVCTTRTMTGVGMPQLSGIMECADAAHGLGGHIIADGGCVEPGDVAKAFGSGADFVMLGGMLAGHDESEMEVVAGQYEFYGMSSNRAMQEHGQRKDGYRSSEGRHVRLDARGSAEGTVVEILGGVRSACTYIGARRIKDMPKCATFILVNATHNTVYNNETVGD